MSKFFNPGSNFVHLAKLHDYSDLDLSLFFTALINSRRTLGNCTFLMCTPDVGSIFQILSQEYYCSDDISHVDSFCAMLNEWSKKYQDGFVFSFFSYRVDIHDQVAVQIMSIGAVDPKEELVEVLKI